MRGTMVCGVTDTDEGREALELGIELSERFGLRLVLAHVAEGIAPIGGNGESEGEESVTMKASRVAAALLVERLAAEYGVANSVERRSAVGDPGIMLGQIAAEEAADVILVGARTRGLLRRGIESRLAEQLETETLVPVLIAPPRGRARKSLAMDGGQR
jgi:nucleotide-binding universal stress UspA family protein